MTKFNLFIKTAKGELYWTENFEDRKALDRWLAKAKTEPAWKKDFVVEIQDNTAAIEQFEAERKSRIEAEELAEKQKRQDARAAVKVFKEKPSKTVADVVKLLEVLIDVLDLKPDEATTKVK